MATLNYFLRLILIYFKLAPLTINIKTYEVCQSNETHFLFTKVFIFFKDQCYLFQNNFLGRLHTDGDVPTYGSSAVSLQPEWPSAYSLHSFGCSLLKSQNYFF